MQKKGEIMTTIGPIQFFSGDDDKKPVPQKNLNKEKEQNELSQLLSKPKKQENVKKDPISQFYADEAKADEELQKAQSDEGTEEEP